MELFDSAILLVIALLFSAVISQFVPKISTPLIQVAMGIFLALGPISFDMQFEPELFMILFIAPLLFNDGKLVDKKALWDLKGSILSLALGLVLATVLCIGYFVHWMIPTIPLAAAFALAAALAPTDAVAVSSMSDSVNTSPYENHLLEGESLINDASGIVSFQFAVAAMVTGTFSIAQASESFLITFLGGIAVGLVLAFLRFILVRWLRSTGVESTTFHVLIEILMPFVVYIIAERIGVSGILAVVAAGIFQSFKGRSVSPAAAKLNIVSTSVWSVLIFVLNGLVFLTLGTQLPSTLRGIWTGSETSNLQLVGYVLAISAAMLLLRFVWALIMPSKGDPQTRLLQKALRGLSRRERRALKRTQPKVSFKEEVHQAAVLSLGGVKGAITLITVLTLPYLLRNGAKFPERSLIIFLASAAIVVSLLVANFILPLLAPMPHEEKDTEGEIEASIEILRTVLRELSWQLHSGDRANRLATEEVINEYSRRIARVKASNELEDSSRDKLRLKAIDWEREYTLRLVDEGRVNSFAAYFFLYRLNRTRARIAHKRDPWWLFRDLRYQFKHRKELHSKAKAEAKKNGSKHGHTEERLKARTSVAQLTVLNCDYVLDKLNVMMCHRDVETEDVTSLISEFTRKRDRTVWQMQRDEIRRNMEDGLSPQQAAAEAAEAVSEDEADVEAEAGFAPKSNVYKNGNGIDTRPRDLRGDIDTKPGNGNGAIDFSKADSRIGGTPIEREAFEIRLAEVEAQGLQYEREAIQTMFEQGKISTETAKALRDNVALMELDITDSLS